MTTFVHPEYKAPIGDLSDVVTYADTQTEELLARGMITALRVIDKNIDPDMLPVEVMTAFKKAKRLENDRQRKEQSEQARSFGDGFNLAVCALADMIHNSELAEKQKQNILTGMSQTLESLRG